MRKGTVRDMKKNVLLRGLFGIPTGIAIGYVITVMMSAFWGDGSYYPCVPAFVDAMGSEIRAVVVQTVLCGLVGMAGGTVSADAGPESGLRRADGGVFSDYTRLDASGGVCGILDGAQRRGCAWLRRNLLCDLRWNLDCPVSWMARKNKSYK